MKFQPYEAVLIPPDLRHDECIVQVADCLDHLDRVTAAVMDGILARVAEYRSRLQDIQARADLARAKISIIRGSSKATKVTVIAFLQHRITSATLKQTSVSLQW
ncbi:cxyorf1, putative [Ixodes scapularis]|uniref:Cxyorf1, putative n=1 Tax=Ixodes scapularis TaxID=6945 RepID=B7PGM1_IXOSC|nr:cxyorf1, putative [Ixodes scapularis]|eukprot:XP_002400923.1 cxyorf1, putative [Ixodes scapularis]